MGQTALVLGGGTGGVVAANVLRDTLGAQHRVVLLSRHHQHVYYGALPLLMVGLRVPSDISRPLARLRRRGIDFLRAEVLGLDPERREVHTSQGTVNYDYLVISLGAQHQPSTVPGMDRGSLNPYDIEDVVRIAQSVESMERGRILYFISSLPYSCPQAPYETMLILEDHLRRQGRRNRFQLSIVTPESHPQILGCTITARKLMSTLKQREITLRAGVRVLRMEPEKRRLVMDHNLSETADLFLGLPPHWGPEIMRNSPLADQSGWIEVDPHTLQTADERIWAVGDATGLRTPSTGAFAAKAGVFAHFQAEVVARNIACLLEGSEPRFRYRGKGGCFVAQSLSQGRYVLVRNYSQPAPVVWASPPSRAVYWAKLAFERYWLSRWF